MLLSSRGTLYPSIPVGLSSHEMNKYLEREIISYLLLDPLVWLPSPSSAGIAVIQVISNLLIVKSNAQSSFP